MPTRSEEAAEQAIQRVIARRAAESCLEKAKEINTEGGGGLT